MCQIIHSCNKPLEKVSIHKRIYCGIPVINYFPISAQVTDCVNLLWKCLDNIIQNPTDQKFRQIKCAGVSFQNKIAPVFGGELFLKTAAFRKDMIENKDLWNKEEEYWVFDPEDDTCFGPELIELRDMLKKTNPIKPVLDRNIQVLRNIQIATKTE